MNSSSGIDPAVYAGTRRKTNPEYTRIARRLKNARQHGDRAAAATWEKQLRTLPSRRPDGPRLPAAAVHKVRG